MAKRIYKVVVESSYREPGEDLTHYDQIVHLVRAASVSQAERHVMRQIVKASTVSQDKLVELIQEGVNIEEAGVHEQPGC